MTSSNYWDKLMGSDAMAATYMESYGEGPGCYTRLAIGSHIPPGSTVLDIACGPAWNLDHFMKFGPQISFYKGIDYSKRFIRVANKRKHDDSNYSFPYTIELGDLRHPQEHDKSFDVVILQDALEYANGYDKPLREALRIAKQRVIVTFWRMTPEREDKVNIDPDDGFGAEYNQLNWEKYLKDMELEYITFEAPPEEHRPHLFYIIEVPYV